MSEERAAAVARTRFWVPSFWSRQADDFNCSSWSFQWAVFHIWAASCPHFGIRIETDHEFRIQAHLPYMHAAIIIPLVSTNFYYGKLARKGRLP